MEKAESCKESNGDLEGESPRKRTVVVKIPLRSTQSETARCKKGMIKTQEDTAGQSKFNIAVNNLCNLLMIPPLPSILKLSKRLFEEKLSKLEFLNDQMMEIYARASLYKVTQRTTGKKKQHFQGNIKKAIFEKALREIQDLDDTTDVEAEEEKTGEYVCNLYRIRK